MDTPKLSLHFWDERMKKKERRKRKRRGGRKEWI